MVRSTTTHSSAPDSSSAVTSIDSRTDSETILHLYEERGLDFVHDIEGDYAIAIWDATREQLVLVRDRIGVKPLYYYFKDGRFIFASEIKAILQHPAVTPDIDETSALSLPDVSHHARAHTLFRDIQKLPAGHLLTLSRDGTMKIQPVLGRASARTTNSAKRRRSQSGDPSVAARLDRKRMMSDVPFGVFLSGGVDSSANVALMSEQMTRPVETFTVGFSDAEYLNELESARRIAKQFATNHHEVIISEKEMQDFLPALVFHQDEPIADPVCVPLYYVSKLARDSGTIVVQVGEGSDEIFSGYENYVRHLRIYENFWRHAENLPLALRRTVANHLASGPGSHWPKTRSDRVNTTTRRR